MTEALKQIRDYISDGRFIDAMTLLDEVMTDCQQLVTKCNELEKEKTAQHDTIIDLIAKCHQLEAENAHDWLKMDRKLNIATQALVDIYTKLDKKDMVLLSNPPQESEHNVFARIIDTALQKIRGVK